MKWRKSCRTNCRWQSTGWTSRNSKSEGAGKSTVVEFFSYSSLSFLGGVSVALWTAARALMTENLTWSFFPFEIFRKNLQENLQEIRKDLQGKYSRKIFRSNFKKNLQERSLRTITRKILKERSSENTPGTAG